MTPFVGILPPRARTVFGLAAGAAILGILVAERRWPLRRQKHDGALRTVRNVAMGAMCAAVIAVAETPATQAVARANQRRCRGIAGLIPAPFGAIAAFATMDYGFFIWHVATHRSELLWRFHRVHHLDPDMDMTTAIRFHFIDMLVSLPWRLIQVRVSGITPAGLQMWQRFFTASILFHHSNLALPTGWDDRASWLLTTPGMHGIHHSVVRSERDSNWSSGLSIWDRLHGTFRRRPLLDAAMIGVGDRHSADDVAIGPALLAPFIRSAND